MFLIQQITDNPLQQQTLILPSNGVPILLELYFRPLQQGWFINQITYQDFIVRGMRVVNSPNMLYQFKNLIPFGLGCFSDGNREPSLQEDFSSGASKLYILSEEEVEEYTDYLQHGA